MKNLIMNKYFIYYFISNFLIITNIFSSYDLTVIGPAYFNDGLGRISIGVIDNLKHDLKVNFINSRTFIQTKELSNDLINILKQNNNDLGKIIFLTDSLNNGQILSKINTHKSKNIMLVYSMFESTKIPNKWVKNINNFFDAVIVPDEFLVDVYLNSGVQKPIFVLPLGIYLNDFFNKKNNKQKNDFTFGCLANFDLRKNHKILIEAFAKEFGNNRNVLLRINGRYFNADHLDKYIKSLKCNNIILTNYSLAWKDYIKFMSEIDCYVSISKGEGFSIPPREALAMEIPCILTNNTAQKTICNTGFVKSIESNILESALFPETYAKENLGNFFNCELDEARKALKEVYHNYDFYLKKASNAKEWVNQYNWQNIKKKYLTLFKPEKIILGSYNQINEKCIITNSKDLYNKYLNLINNN